MLQCGLTLSIFEKCSFDEFTSMIEKDESISADLRKGIINIYKKDYFNIENYFNPMYGSRLPQSFTLWNSKYYPQTTFLTANIDDGFLKMCQSFQKKMHCPFTRINLSNKNYPPESMYWFQHIKPSGEERLVYANKEDRWIFYEEGKPLPFENEAYYKRRIIKERLNYDIIVEYLSKMGINLLDIDEGVTNCMTFERTAWE